eukprot:jgi/Hompol1/3445/HPOL_003250-RA
MSEEQKDLLDMQIQTTIKGCLTMIQGLARLAETTPTAKESGKQRMTLMSLFGGNHSSDHDNETNAQDPNAGVSQIKAMRESVVWILERRLMEVSNKQHDMQEYRLQRNIDRYEGSISSSPISFANRLIPDAVKSRVAAVMPSAFGMANRAGTTAGGGIGRVPGTESASDTNGWGLDEFDIDGEQHTNQNHDGEDSDQEFDLDLTPQQRMQLEQENEAILNELEGTLDLVK